MKDTQQAGNEADQNRGTYTLTITKTLKWLASLAAISILLYLFLPIVVGDPLPQVNKFQKYLTLGLVGVPAFIVLFCKSVSFSVRGARAAVYVVIFIFLAAAGWLFPRVCAKAHAYINPAGPELMPQLDTPTDVIFDPETEQKVFVFTFDDGPTPRKTEAVLDVLKEEGVKATFFILGKNIAGNEQIIRRTAEEGHEIANHSWNHPRSAFLLPSQIREEFESTNQALEAITGKRPVLARPPFGCINLLGVRCLKGIGLTTTLWNTSSQDYLHDGEDNILARVMKEQPKTSIMLFHEWASSPRVIRETIHEFRRRGYIFVTVSELTRMLETQQSK